MLKCIYNHIHPENSYRDSITFVFVVACACTMIMSAQTGFITSNNVQSNECIDLMIIIFFGRNRNKAMPKKM